MSITVNLRKMLHRKSPEYCTPNPAGNTAAGCFFVSDKSDTVPAHDSAYYVSGVSAIWNYNADEDSWMQIPNSGITGLSVQALAGSSGRCRLRAARSP